MPVMRWRFGCSWECDASVADCNTTHSARSMTAYFRLRVTLNKCCMTAVLANPHDEFRAFENRGSIFCVLAAGSAIFANMLTDRQTGTCCTTMKYSSKGRARVRTAALCLGCGFPFSVPG